MGSPKALLAFPDGKTLIAHQAALLAQAGCHPVIAVVGADANTIIAGSGDLPVQWVTNARWECGQFSSLQAGLRAALAAGATSTVVLPVDVAGVAPATVAALIETALRNNHADAVIPECDGHRGHPLVLSRAFCEALVARDPLDPNARLDLLLHDAKNAIILPVADPRIARNINTPEEWRAFLAGR